MGEPTGTDSCSHGKDMYVEGAENRTCRNGSQGVEHPLLSYFTNGPNMYIDHVKTPRAEPTEENNARSMIMIPSHCPRRFSSAAKTTILQCTLSNESADTVHTSNLSCIAPMCPTRCTPSIDALGPTKQPSPHFCSPPAPDLGHRMARSSLL